MSNSKFKNNNKLFDSKIYQELSTYVKGDIVNYYQEELDKGKTIYIEPPCLLVDSNWTIEDEHKLYEEIRRLDKEGYNWVLATIMTYNGRVNDDIVNFIKEYDVTYLGYSIDNDYKLDYTQEIMVRRKGK